MARNNANTKYAPVITTIQTMATFIVTFRGLDKEQQAVVKSFIDDIMQFEESEIVKSWSTFHRCWFIESNKVSKPLFDKMRADIAELDKPAEAAKTTSNPELPENLDKLTKAQLQDLLANFAK